MSDHEYTVKFPGCPPLVYWVSNRMETGDDTSMADLIVDECIEEVQIARAKRREKNG